MKRFPPIINMLYLDKEIEHQFTVKRAQMQLQRYYPQIARAGSIKNPKNMLQSLLTGAENITPQQIEQEMKSKLTEVFN